MEARKRGSQEVKLYSEAFKLQVVREYEAGEYQSLYEASRRYNIGGCETVGKWLKKYGKEHLMKRVIRVEAPGEGDRLRALEKEVKQLKMALAEAHLDLRLEAEYLRVACGRAGISDVEGFKKKHAGKP
jgi:transposase